MSQNQNHSFKNPENLLTVESHAAGYTKASLEAQGYVAETHPRYWLNVAAKRKASLEAAEATKPKPQPQVERVFVHDEDTRGYEALQIAATRQGLAAGALDEAGVVMTPVEVVDRQQNEL